MNKQIKDRWNSVGPEYEDVPSIVVTSEKTLENFAKLIAKEILGYAKPDLTDHEIEFAVDFYFDDEVFDD